MLCHLLKYHCSRILLSGENEIKYDKAKMIPFMGNFDKDKQHMSSVGKSQADMRH